VTASSRPHKIRPHFKPVWLSAVAGYWVTASRLTAFLEVDARAAAPAAPHHPKPVDAVQKMVEWLSSRRVPEKPGNDLNLLSYFTQQLAGPEDDAMVMIVGSGGRRNRTLGTAPGHYPACGNRTASSRGCRL
jgi:hypothetical protein